MNGTGVVGALCELFERTWEHATPLGMERPRRSGDELTGQEKAVMRLLADGLTDGVIARRLGVSIRTSRRVTAELMARLSARSRFQAGVRAAEPGLLGPKPADGLGIDNPPDRATSADAGDANLADRIPETPAAIRGVLARG